MSVARRSMWRVSQVRFYRGRAYGAVELILETSKLIVRDQGHNDECERIVALKPRKTMACSLMCVALIVGESRCIPEG